MNAHNRHTAPGVDAAHEEAQALLPWLANGRLAGAELERVQSHLKLCAPCRAELALLHTLRAADAVGDIETEAAPGCDAERALARLMPQLDAPMPSQSAKPAPGQAPAQLPRAEAPPALRGWRLRFAANDPHWLRAAVALQCGVIAVLAVLLARPSGSADVRTAVQEAPQAGAYRVLGADTGVQGRLVVAFKPDTPERELRSIVLASGARIVGGPTVTGAWILGTGDDPAAVATRLHAMPAVTLAEALGAEGGP